MELLIQPGKLTLADLRQAYLNPIKVKLDDSASAAINASVACVEQIVNEGRTAYG
ncbi:MAG: histidine ammonia-lyase, partial [Acinetobacter calcoaceticus]